VPVEMRSSASLLLDSGRPHASRSNRRLRAVRAVTQAPLRSRYVARSVASSFRRAYISAHVAYAACKQAQSVSARPSNGGSRVAAETEGGSIRTDRQGRRMQDTGSAPIGRPITHSDTRSLGWVLEELN